MKPVPSSILDISLSVHPQDHSIDSMIDRGLSFNKPYHHFCMPYLRVNYAFPYTRPSGHFKTQTGAIQYLMDSFTLKHQYEDLHNESCNLESFTWDTTYSPCKNVISMIDARPGNECPFSIFGIHKLPQERSCFLKTYRNLQTSPKEMIF